FLAGLWLAPLIDKSVLTIFLGIVIVPVMLLVTIFFWKRIKTASLLQRAMRGHDSGGAPGHLPRLSVKRCCRGKPVRRRFQTVAVQHTGSPLRPAQQHHHRA